jgi:hypothetical protein
MERLVDLVAGESTMPFLTLFRTLQASRRVDDEVLALQ